MSHRKTDRKHVEDDSLPDGWIAAWSQTKQKAYYCNRKLGVSQWSRPTKDDKGEILNVLSEMDSTNKARNTMIRNARKRLMERESLVKSEQLKDQTSTCDRHETSSHPRTKKTQKHSTAAQFVRTFSVVTDDDIHGKKVKGNVRFQRDNTGDAVRDKNQKIGREKDKSKDSLLKFKIKTDKAAKILKSRKKDSPALKSFAKSMPKHNVNKTTGQLCKTNAWKVAESHTKHAKEAKSDLDCSYSATSLPPNEILHNKSHDRTSWEQQSRDQEEDMEYETSPEEYAKLMNEINEIRENFSDKDILKGEQGLTSGLFTSYSSVTDVRGSEQKVLYIIIDTNILLNSLNFISTLQDIRLTDYSSHCLVIPWIVMNELDLIKDNKKKIVSERTEKMAWSAVKYLHDHLQRKDPFILAQTPSEACKKCNKLEIITNNDDKILQCCIQWKEKYPQSDVFLLTGDIHLCTKAIVLDIPDYKEKTLRKWLDDRKVHGYKRIQEKTGTSDTRRLTCRKGDTQKQNQSHLNGFVDVNQSGVSDRVSQAEMTQTTASQSDPFTSSRMNESAHSVRGNNRQLSASTVQAMEAEQFVPFTSSSSADNSVPCTMLDHSNGIVDSSLYVRTTSAVHYKNTDHLRVSPTQNRNAESRLSPSEMARTFLDKVQYILQRELGDFLQYQMKRIYDDLWSSIIYKKPPWNVDDVLFCLKKHWIAVFGDLLGRNNLSQLEEFISTTKHCQGCSYYEVLTYLKKAVSLCDGFKENISDRSFDILLKALHKTELLLERVINGNISPESAMMMLSDETSNQTEKCLDIVQSAFQDVWIKILNITTDIKVCLLDNQSLSDRMTIVNEFAEFCSLVARIHYYYSQMLSEMTTANDDDRHERHLYSALVHSLAVFAKHYNIADWREPTPEQILSFVDEPQGRIIINNGYLQLQNLMSTLCEYNSCLSMEESQLVQTAINRATAVL